MMSSSALLSVLTKHSSTTYSGNNNNNHIHKQPRQPSCQKYLEITGKPQGHTQQPQEILQDPKTVTSPKYSQHNYQTKD